MMKCFHIISSRKKRTGESSPELRGPSTKPPRTIPELCRDKEQKLREFSFSELRNATKIFNKSFKIGEGGVGSVYKGSIKPPAGGKGGPLVVAIKKLNISFNEGHKEWLAEVQFLGVVEHPNLVKLLGYCSTDIRPRVQRLLVYEYMSNKSLESHLFSRASRPIPWRKRLQILLGAAQGLLYLHEGLETQVICRDFKSANVLLDENFNPKLSDWGLERKGLEDYQENTFEMRPETYAYVAPEYMLSGRITSKCDVWSFGVVLYEILSGRKAVGVNLPQSEKGFISWVKEFPVNSTRFWMIMDPRLNHQYSRDAARKVAKLADSCLKNNPEDRPTMSQVVDVLQEAIKVSEDDITSPLPESSTRRMVHVG